eukprot:9513696-Heterocapsa_arctica.AAC.1
MRFCMRAMSCGSCAMGLGEEGAAPRMGPYGPSGVPGHAAGGNKSKGGGGSGIAGAKGWVGSGANKPR